MFVGEWMLFSLYEEINVVKIVRTNISRVQADYMVELCLLDATDEKTLRQSYRNCLTEAQGKNINSIALPLVCLGNGLLSREEGLRVALGEINGFPALCNLDIFLVIEGERYLPLDIELMDKLRNYVYDYYSNISTSTRGIGNSCGFELPRKSRPDSFSQYLLYLIERNGMSNREVCKRALFSEEILSSLEKDIDYRPTKDTALRFCIGAKLDITESKDLLSRAGYTLSPCEKTDIIFSFYIENEHYDLIDIDIQLEEYGLPCIIS